MKKIILAVVLGVILAGSYAFALTEGKEYFVNTALHAVRGDEIYWINYTDKSTLIPAGDKVKITAISGHIIKFEHRGKEYNFAFTDKGNSGNTEIYSKFFTEKNIKAEIDAYPDKIKGSVKRGVAEKGMTKEQMLRAVGCPATVNGQKAFNMSLKDIMESDDWIYYFNRFNRWQAIFKDGILVNIKN